MPTTIGRSDELQDVFEDAKAVPRSGLGSDLVHLGAPFLPVLRGHPPHPAARSPGQGSRSDDEASARSHAQAKPSMASTLDSALGLDAGEHGGTIARPTNEPHHAASLHAGSVADAG